MTKKICNIPAVDIAEISKTRLADYSVERNQVWHIICLDQLKEGLCKFDQMSRNLWDVKVFDYLYSLLSARVKSLTFSAWLSYYNDSISKTPRNVGLIDSWSLNLEGKGLLEQY